MSNAARATFESGKPLLFWKNRTEPFRIGSQTVAASGKVAIVQTVPDGTKGRPILIEYRMARASDILGWLAQVENDSISLDITGLPSCIFSMRDPLPTPQNEVLKDQSWDVGQTLPDGFDYWRGVMNLIATE